MKTFEPISNLVKQQLLTQLCEQLDDTIFILDANLCYLSVNAAYEIIIGYNEKFLLGKPLGIYAAKFLTEQEQAILSAISTGLDSDGFYENSFAMATRYGQTLNCHITYRKVCVDGIKYHVGMVRDISAKVADNKQLTHLINYDQLTGLPNRKVFLSQISDSLMDSYQELIVVRINIDGYRNLANILGQEAINALMVSFVARVQDLKLDSLLCFSHFGGDDFGLLFELDNANMVRHQLDRLMQMCEQPFLLSKFMDQQSIEKLCVQDSGESTAIRRIEEQSVKDTIQDSLQGSFKDPKIYFHLSVGVSYFPKDDTQLLGLVNKAEKALSYVKHKGGDDVCWYHYGLEQTSDNLELEYELRQALKEGQFEPFYQPKVILDTGVITGFEALVRWRHPTRGLLSPVEFIEAIVKYKLSFELFSQMSEKIAQQLVDWQALGFDQHICINADASEFSHPDFIESVSRLLSQYPLNPYQLHIEVTESSLMLRSACVKKQLTDLKTLGVRLALDDFGTGYASLSYLQEYPFDFIKVDKSFISKIVTDNKQQAIVQAILDLAVALEMSAIAEGIETQPQCQLLQKMGCPYGQGYWFGRPVCAEEATAILIRATAPK